MFLDINTLRGVWDVLVLAPISTMENGGRFMGAARKGVQAVSPAPALLELALTRMVVAFWARLRSFAALRPRYPFLWLMSVVMR